MTIPGSHIGRFTSTREATVYARARDLANDVGKVASMMAAQDDVSGVDLNDKVKGSVLVKDADIYPSGWIFTPEFSGSLQQDAAGKVESMDVSERGLGDLTSSRLRIRVTGDSTEYRRSHLGYSRSVRVDASTGDMEYRRSFLGIPLPS